MIHNLAVLSGFGNLSEEVNVLARSLSVKCFTYTIKPWFQRDPLRRFAENVGEINRVVALHPFQFSEIKSELQKNSIDSIFLTGDFPKDRFVQARLSELWPRFFNVADDLCVRYFALTPSELPQAVRYFLALERLLGDLKVRPILANEIFPALNFSCGCVSTKQPPLELLDQMPNIVTRALERLSVTSPGQNRFSQAVIVDRNVICAVEAAGTDALLRNYAASAMGKRQTMPFL